MMINKSKFGKLLATGGVVGGIIYGMKNQKNFTQTAFYAVGFGILGLVIGNAITNWTE